MAIHPCALACAGSCLHALSHRPTSPSALEPRGDSHNFLNWSSAQRYVPIASARSRGSLQGHADRQAKPVCWVTGNRRGSPVASCVMQLLRNIDPCYVPAASAASRSIQAHWVKPLPRQWSGIHFMSRNTRRCRKYVLGPYVHMPGLSSGIYVTDKAVSVPQKQMIKHVSICVTILN